MRKIVKNPSDVPRGFEAWVKQKPRNKSPYEWWAELYKQQNYQVVSELAAANAKAQYYVCAYCTSTITGDTSDTMNEHVEARSVAPNRSLDYTNIVASCKAKNQCDDAHKGQYLPITPFMDACEKEITFDISGRAIGATNNARDTIDILNLGKDETSNKQLVQKRKQLSHALLFKNGVDPSEGLEDYELLEMLVHDLSTPVNGRLESFAPAVVSILKGWL